MLLRIDVGVLSKGEPPAIVIPPCPTRKFGKISENVPSVPLAPPLTNVSELCFHAHGAKQSHNEENPYEYL
jgi:hypothetical protein